MHYVQLLHVESPALQLPAVNAYEQNSAYEQNFCLRQTTEPWQWIAKIINLHKGKVLGFLWNSWRLPSPLLFFSKGFIQMGLVERVAVIFFRDDKVPIERFVFKLNVNQSYGAKVEQADLEFSLRSFLIKLPVSEPMTKVLPCNCRWEITAYFRSLPQTSTSKDSEMWIPTDTKQWQQLPVITPIRSMSSEPLGLQLYLEHASLSEPNP